MVRFPRKRLILRHPQPPENISEDNSQPPSSDVVVLTNLPYSSVSSSVDNDLDQYSNISSIYSSCNSIGSSSCTITNRQRQRRFRVPPIRVPQFHRRRRPSLHQPSSSSSSHSVVSLPPLSNHIDHNATTTTTTATTHSQYPLQAQLSPSGSRITPKQRSHLHLLPWRKQNPMSRGKKQNGSTITPTSTTSRSLINGETIIHHPSIPKKEMMMVPPPIHTEFNTTTTTVMDETEKNLGHNIRMDSTILTSIKPERPTTAVIVTPNHNQDNDDENVQMITTPTHPNHTDSLALLVTPRITPTPHIVVPISPDNVMMDHLSLVKDKENERQSPLHHYHHSRFDSDVSTTVIMTPSNIESKQMMNIVTPERFDGCIDDNHTDQLLQQQNDIDRCGGDVVVVTKTLEHSLIRNIQQDPKQKRSYVDWDNTTAMNRASTSSTPSLLQECQCLKLSNLYTTIPNLSSNPWTAGCSM